MVMFIQSIFELLVGLLTTPRAYHRFLLLPVKQILATFLVGILLISTLWMARITTRTVPLIAGYTTQALTEFISAYPDDLVVTWDGNSLTTQPNQNHDIHFPSFIPQDTPELPSKLVTYSSTNHQLEDLPNQSIDSFLVITPTQLFVQGSQGDVSELPLTEAPGFEDSFTLTKTDLQKRVDTWKMNAADFYQSVIWLVIAIGPVYVLVTTLWSGLVLYLLSYALVVFLYRMPFTASQLLRLCIPITLVAAAIHITGQLLYANLVIPLFSITYWILLVIVIKTLPVVKRAP